MQELIWDGHDPSSVGPIIGGVNIRPIQYQGSTHLLYTGRRKDKLAYHCIHRILNSRYESVAEFAALDDSAELDGHDFEMFENGKGYIQGAGRMIPLGEADHVRPVLNAMFQEVDLETREVVFEWRSLDHAPVEESCVNPTPGYIYDYLCVTRKPSRKFGEHPLKV